MAGAESSLVIRIDPVASEAEKLWSLALDLAQALGPEREWALIGGLMVQLHGLEHSDQLRPTVDIDLLGGARQPPAMTEEIASLINERGAKVAMPPRSDPEVGYRFELDGEIVEILGPDGLRSDPKTLGKLTTFQVPGGTQALRRTEVVLVSLRDSSPIYVEDPRDLARVEQLKPTEKKWLRKVERALDFDDAALPALFPAAVIQRAQQAFRLLSA